MKSAFQFAFVALIALSFTTGCGSTRVENGVTIQKSAPSYNPLNYIPGLK